jgi:RNA polymerase sigma factor (sigma-70 family)
VPDATDDLVQQVSLRFFRTPPEQRPKTARDYFGFVTLQIRRELIDVIRKAQRRLGPLGSAGSNTGPYPEISDHTQDPAKLAEWADFHHKVGELPDEEREVLELWWYGERPQPDAEMLGVSLATVKRRLLRARRQLDALLGGQLPF